MEKERLALKHSYRSGWIELPANLTVRRHQVLLSGEGEYRYFRPDDSIFIRRNPELPQFLMRGSSPMTVSHKYTVIYQVTSKRSSFGIFEYGESDAVLAASWRWTAS
jgi:hypothetical protein